MPRFRILWAVILIGVPHDSCWGQVVQFQQSDGVQLRLRGNVPLQALVDYVGERLGIAFVYDEEIGERRINVRAPNEIPVDSLLNLLGSVLKSEGLILVRSEMPGWMRIVAATEMARVSPPRASDPDVPPNPATPITRMFALRNTQPQALLTVLRPFLTKAGGNQIALDESGILIVTDYASVVENVAILVEMLDRGRGQSQIRYYQVSNADVEQLTTKVQELLASPHIKLIGEPRTRLIAVAGVPPQLDQAVKLLERFDAAVERDGARLPFQEYSGESRGTDPKQSAPG